MTPERVRQIEELYHAARENRAVLAQADPDLRREVESLLARDSSKPGTLDRPAWEGAAGLTNIDATMTVITPGTQLGPYKIEGPLGAGGMGQVFRAVDTRLGRAVAIKTSQAQFSERFEREARAISALNHPNICTLHDVGPNYLVMELCEGDTLAARLKKGKLSIDDTVRYGTQIADALAAAHAKGIVHRDLKPGNIMLTKSGVKVLDFGLAKAPQDETLTGSRVVMGTPAYMAPEQREGKECDARTDIYALGLVLYEMATGKRAPQGEPPAMEDVPARLAPVIERCLAPDPEDRWHAAKDLKAVLEWTGKPQITPLSARPSPSKTRRWIWGISALLGLGFIAGGIWVWRRSTLTASERPARFTLSFGEDAETRFPDALPIPSPDGQYFVFEQSDAQRGTSLSLRPLNSTEAKSLPGTEGTSVPFWSPDGRWIGFYAAGKLKKISPAGGPPQTIADLPAVQEAAWGSAGDIIFRPSNRMPLFRIHESGGTPTVLTQLDRSRSENSHRGLSFLPDGHKFLYTARCGDRANNALYIGSLDTGKVRRLMPIESQARYVPSNGDRPGALVYYRDGALVARQFDPVSEEIAGDPVPVLDRVLYNPTGLGAGFQISADGRVAMIRLAGGGDTQLLWHERDGRQAGTLGPRGDYLQPRISPDGTRVAVEEPDPQTGNRDVFILEVVRGVNSRLTTHVANDWFPVWSPDGKQILFGSDRDGGTANLNYLKTSLDAGASESRLPGENPSDWSRDGHWISFGASDIFVTAAAPDAKPFPYLATPFFENSARFSPDGKWLAYTSNESGRFEVYVRPFAGVPAPPEGKIQISNGGGDFPVWNPDGKELYFMDAGATIYAANSEGLGRSPQLPKITKLFHACPERRVMIGPVTGESYAHSYDTHDGKRFLVNCTAEPSGQFTVLLNWAFGAKP
jgi:serine/threonine protein kinase